MNYFVEVPLLFIQSCRQAVGPLHIDHKIFHLILKPLFGLLQGGALGVHSFDLLLSLLQALRKLLPAGSNR